MECSRAASVGASQTFQFGGGGPASFQPNETATLVRRIDDEDDRVVDRVVLQLGALVGQVDPKMQPAVSERRPFGVEPKRQRPGALVPPELGCRHRTGGDEN